LQPVESSVAIVPAIIILSQIVDSASCGSKHAAN